MCLCIPLSLLGNGSGKHVAATDTHTTIEDTSFSIRFVLYHMKAGD
jgi:hypothetical protein